MRFQSLTDYRERLLREPQCEIARRAKTSQGYVSSCERGHMPKPWRIDQIANAYRLKRGEFMRLIEAARASRALQVPVSESEPLFAHAMQPNIRRLALRMMLEKTFGKAVRA